MSESQALAMPDPKKNTVLVPQQAVVGRISPFHTVGWTCISLDRETETYAVQGGGRALHKSALNKIASAAGIRVLSSKNITPITPEHFIWQVEVELPLANAKPVRGVGSKEWMKGVGKDGNDMEHRVTKTETKATLRAIRQVLGVRTKYTDAEIAQPIAVPHIDYNPDLTDEGVRDVMRQRNALAEAALYGGDEEARETPAEGIDPLTGEMSDEIAAEYEVVENDEAEAFAPVEAEVIEAQVVSDDAWMEELRELQSYSLVSSKSPFNGFTFARIWIDENAGKGWFDQVIAWGANQLTLDAANKLNVANAKRFLELVAKNGGELA